MENSYRKFEKLVAKIFELYDSDANVILEGGPNSLDIEITKNENRYGVEVKMFRSRRISISFIQNALIQLSYYLQKHGFNGGILVTSANISPPIREKLIEEFSIEIIDRGILFFLTENDENLRKELESILLELLQSGEESIFDGIKSPSDDYKISFIANTKLVEAPKEVGKNLCDELNKLDAGKAKAKEYELKCEEILKYIFAEDFSNWQRQIITRDTLHKYDLIAKISSLNDFWIGLARDFHSRFVIFEFKNYRKEIKQGQVYSTEKYLFGTALRNIAIVISRKGADRNAIKAMEGSLREIGKLIINLNQEELCRLLNMKDKGEDPNTYLTEKIDRILMQLSR